MTREHAVLCVGEDWLLLKQRLQTLKSAGFQVILARDANQARTVVHYFCFQAALLCYTLREDLQETLTADMRGVQPSLPILQLQPQDDGTEALITAVSVVTGSLEDEPRPKARYLSCWARCRALEQRIAS